MGGTALRAKGAIKWPLVQDPVDKGTVLSTNDPAITPTTVGKYGVADIVTKKADRDFRLAG